MRPNSLTTQKGICLTTDFLSHKKISDIPSTPQEQNPNTKKKHVFISAISKEPLGGAGADHEGGVVEVPGEGGQALGHRINDGVLHDVDGAGQVGGEHLLGPARQAVGLGEEAPGEQPVVCCDLPVDHVLCEHMGAAGNRDTLGHTLVYLFCMSLAVSKGLQGPLLL